MAKLLLIWRLAVKDIRRRPVQASCRCSIPDFQAIQKTTAVHMSHER